MRPSAAWAPPRPVGWCASCASRRWTHTAGNGGRRAASKTVATAVTATERAIKIDAALAAARHNNVYLADDNKAEIRICAGTACHASGRVALREAIRKALDDRDLSDTVVVVETGCHGFCEEGPIVVLRPQGIFYPRLEPKDVEEIIDTSVLGNGVVERLLYRHPHTGEPVPLERDIPFYAQQKRVVLGLNGKIDPFSLDDYLATEAIRRWPRCSR